MANFSPKLLLSAMHVALLSLFFSLSLTLLSAAGATISGGPATRTTVSATARSEFRELLERSGFPEGLFPVESVKSFTFKATDEYSAFTVELNASCFAAVEPSFFYASYDRSISGKIDVGKIYDVSGLTAGFPYIPMYGPVDSVAVKDENALVFVYFGNQEFDVKPESFSPAPECVPLVDTAAAFLVAL